MEIILVNLSKVRHSSATKVMLRAPLGAGSAVGPRHVSAVASQTNLQSETIGRQ
jgi:hypothetical protein